MADIRITDVPTTSAITDADYLYIRTGNNFRRVLVSALMTLIGSEISVTPEPDFNQKCLAMKLQNGIYVIDNANSDFIGTDYQTFAMFAAAIQQAHMDGYDVFCTIFDGQYQNAVPFLGNLGGAMLKFGGWEFSADGLQPVVYSRWWSTALWSGPRSRRPRPARSTRSSRRFKEVLLWDLYRAQSCLSIPGSS